MTVSPRDLLESATEQAARRRPGVVVGALVDGAAHLHGRGDLAGDTLVEIGSVTKVFTTTLLADAVVRGEVRLDTPVRALLPAGAPVPRRDGVEITLEHLATHRSGLPRSPVGVPVLAGSFTMLRGRNPYAGFGPGELLAGLARTRLRRTPGSGRPSYSNAGFGLLGLALATAADTSFDELVARRVCTPLGLTDTVTPATAGPGHRQRWASGHDRRGRPVEDWVLPGLAGAGAMRSTAADLLTFLGHQLQPAGSPLEEAIRLSQKPRTSSRRRGIGLGWQREGDGAMLWHDGATGGFRSFVAFRRAQGLAVVVLTDSSRGVDLTGLRLMRDLQPAGLR